MHELSDISRELLLSGRAHYVPNYQPRELILDHGLGSRVWDLDDNEYIDLGTGISVNSLGHRNPELLAALQAQSAKLWHTSNIYFTEPPIHLAEELTEATFAERVYFCNSGAEANEAAIKLARKFASEHHPASKRTIITFRGSFHGRTLATVTATAQPKYQKGFEPLPGGFRYCPFNDREAIAAMMNDDVCAVLVEPIQGEGGVTPAVPGFLRTLRDLCDQHGALLMLDEVQSGMGRTGKLFAHEWEGVFPDVLTSAKALGGGLPIGAMLTREHISQSLAVGSHGSTFGGNPITCAVARAVLRQVSDPALLANVVHQGEILIGRLRDLNATLELFTDIRGKGLMIGAQLVESMHGKAGEITEVCRGEGVLILQAGPNVLRFLPPLTIDDTDMTEGLARLENGLRRFTGHHDD